MPLKMLRRMGLLSSPLSLYFSHSCPNIKNLQQHCCSRLCPLLFSLSKELIRSQARVQEEIFNADDSTVHAGSLHARSFPPRLRFSKSALLAPLELRSGVPRLESAV